VNQSLRAAAETRRSEWRKYQALPSRLALSRTRQQADKGLLARLDHTGPLNLVAARYPAVRRLVGELSFRVVARRFIFSEPPCAPIPRSYGDRFPLFIRSLGSAACIEYVADVAELEMLRNKASCAPLAQSLAALVLSSLPAERLNGLRVVLHPSVCWVQSRFPVVSIWENSQTDDDDRVVERWAPEAALVARPFLEIEVRKLPPGGYAFLRALSEAQTVAMAIAIATEATPEFDLFSNLTLLEDAKVIIGIQEAC